MQHGGEDIRQAFMEGRLDSAGRPVTGDSQATSASAHAQSSETHTSGAAATIDAVIFADSPAPKRLSIDEACRFVGVSRETMIRFVEAGYFPGAKTPAAGIEISALESIFGVKIPSSAKRASAAGSRVSPESSVRENIGSSRIEDQAEEREPQISAQISAQRSSTINDEQPADRVPHNQASTAESTTESRANEIFVESDSASGDVDTHAEDGTAFTAVPRKTVMEMYERLIRTLEAEIQSLKGERDWLKRRVEQFEEKASRDQVLMLQETQVIRELLSKALPASRQLEAPQDSQQGEAALSSTIKAGQQPPTAPAKASEVDSTGRAQAATPSPFRAACEWLGLLPGTSDRR